MKRHVYKAPKSNRVANRLIAVAGGLIFTFLVFFLIPLMKKLEDGFGKEPPSIAEEVAEEPPEEFEVEEEIPPEEVEPEPEPELVEDQSLDFTPDILDLGSGPGTVLLSTPSNFNIDDGDLDLGEDDFDQPPRPTTRFDPRYPRNLLKQRKGGRVLVLMTIDERGMVVDAKVKESSGYRELDEAALSAAMRWRFKPGIKGGRKAITTAVQPFTFRVKS